MKSGSANSSLFMILKNSKVQKLLLAMKSGKFNVIEPVIKFNGGVDYPALNKFLDSREDAEETIRILSGVGLLVWEIVDNVAVCPHCGSHKLLLKLRCPSCGSSRILRGAMMEHLECGHIDFEKKFKGAEGLVCPSCRKPLKAIGEDYRTYSFLYRCLACGSVFQSPKVKYLCDNGHEFDDSDITIQSIKAYKLNPEKRELLEQATINIEEVLQPLIEGGWRTEFPAAVPGTTGAIHDFTFASWNKRAGEGGNPPDLVGAIHMSDSEASATDVLAFWAKAVDVGSRRRVMMTIPKMSKEGKNLAKAYDIEVVEGKNAAELQARAKELIRRIVEDAEKEAKNKEKAAEGKRKETPESPEKTEKSDQK